MTISKSGCRVDELRELRDPGDVIADHVAQRLDPIGADHEPQLQRAEATAERHRPFAVVDEAVAGRGCAGKAGRIAERVGQRLPGRG